MAEKPAKKPPDEPVCPTKGCPNRGKPLPAIRVVHDEKGRRYQLYQCSFCREQTTRPAA
jgi:hypothetical protein